MDPVTLTASHAGFFVVRRVRSVGSHQNTVIPFGQPVKKHHFQIGPGGSERPGSPLLVVGCG